MLQSIRRHSQGWIAKLIVGFIILTFAIFGIERLGSLILNNPDTVASIDDQKITQQQLNNTINEQTRILATRLGDRFDPSLLTHKLLRESALKQLIARAILVNTTKKADLAWSDAAINQTIRQDQRFQRNGSYDPDQFQMWLRNYGMTPQQFRDGLRLEQIQHQLQTAYISTAFVLPNEIAQINQLNTQTRTLQYARFTIEKARKKVHYSHAQLQTYYQQHSTQFMQPEQVKIRYIKLDQAHIAQSLPITEADLKTAYNKQLEADREQATNERRISHILITGTDAKSQKIAQSLYQQLNTGASFTKLAKKYSTDSSTANKGGDMGLFIAGLFGDKFDQAALSLNPEQLTKPIKTQYGYEIIRRNPISLPPVVPYAKMKIQLTQQLRTEQAATRFIEQSRELAKISYEAADLKEAAQQFGLKIHSTDFFDRNSQNKGIISNPKVRAAAFSPDVLDGNNSDVIALSPTKAIVLRKETHRGPQLLPFKQVKKQVTSDYIQEKAQKIVLDQANKLLADLKHNNDFSKTVSKHHVTVQSLTRLTRDDTRLPKPALMEAFRLPHPKAKHASYGSANLANGDAVVLAVTQVQEGKKSLNAKEQNLQVETLTRQQGTNDYQHYLAAQQRQADISITPPNQDP